MPSLFIFIYSLNLYSAEIEKAGGQKQDVSFKRGVIVSSLAEEYYAKYFVSGGRIDEFNTL